MMPEACVLRIHVQRVGHDWSDRTELIQIESPDQFGEYAILIILNLLIHEHELSFHFCTSLIFSKMSCNFHVQVLHFC